MQQQGLQGQQLQQLGMQQQQHGIGQIQHPNFQLQNQQRILQQQLQQHQHLQNQQQQQQQLQNQQQQLQNQQQQQQLQNHQQLHGQPQQFVIPPPSKTPPQQLHSPSQHNQQMMNQQQMLAQGTMRPPQSPQQGQPHQGQQVHFQILQPQNRLQVVMGIPPKQQYQQGQQPPSATPMQPNPQNAFRQQQPHVQSSVAQTLKPPFLHSVQQQRPPSMMLSPQPQAQPQQSHPPIQVMQGGQQGSTIQLQSILSPQQQQNKQFLEIGAAAGQQGPGTQHYNVVIHQGQPFTPMNPPPPRQIGQPRHPSQPGLQTQPGQVGQKSSFQPVGQRAGVDQWFQQQQIEIFRQIQMDTNIKAKWNQMDHQQRTLLIGKLVQKHREDQLRNQLQLMMRHQNQQTAMKNQVAQAQSQGQLITAQVASTSSGVQQLMTGPNGQQHIMGARCPILVQSQTPQAAQSPIQAPDKQMNMPPGSPAISVQESDLFWHFILSFRGGRQQQQQQAAWETPIRIPNDVVEKFKTTKRLERTEEHPERVKRMKMAEDEVLQISYLDDLPPPPMDGKEEEDIQPDIENRPPPVIMFSGFSDMFKTLATDKVKALGARITNDVTDATHLVIWEICTCKLYSALCRVKHIVSAGWVRDSYKAKRFVDETGYTPSITTFENFHKVPISDILKKPDRHILFKGMTFYLTPGLTGALRSGLEVIVEAAGGLVDRTNKSMADIKSTARENPIKYLIITNLDDFEYFSEFFDNKPNKTLSIFTAMFIYTCIVDQKVDLGVLPSKKSATKVEPANLG
ncbi:unnamed protein product [Orchesella dallaii]|uniref:PAX-interacting protein 1 n=1 Tax=Orchesella dallaii TaxID=48710 RepID=A0ABP1RWD8_9HEXA